MLKRTLAMAAVTTALIATTAQASLVETMDLELTHDGLMSLSGPSIGTHTYGTTDTLFLISNPTQTWDVSSPAALPGFDKTLLLDFTNFSYDSFAFPFPSNSTLSVSNLVDEVADGSVGVFTLNNQATNIASVVEEDYGFSVTWAASDVAFNPEGPAVLVGWNTVPVPGPGSLALMGLAGLSARGRRRRG